MLQGMPDHPMDRLRPFAAMTTRPLSGSSSAPSSRRRRRGRRAAALISLFSLVLPTACTSTASDGSRPANGAPSALTTQGQPSEQPPMPSSADPGVPSSSSASAPLSVSVAPTSTSTIPSTAAYPDVVDRKGRLLMTKQSVALIKIEPSKIGDVSSAAQSISEVVRPIDPTLTASAIAHQIGETTTTFTLVALRAQLEATQIAALTALPGVTSSLHERLITVDRTLESPLFPQLTTYLSSHPGAASSSALHTTIDLNVQVSAEAAANSEVKPAALVVIQPSTGAILAVAQNAAADAAGPIALNGLYPPGSTFKSITVAQALDSGQATPSTQLPCPGSTTISDRTIPNDGGFDLGTVSLTTAFAHSCNTTMAQLGAAMPPTAMHTMAARFGLGADFDIAGITAVTGTVPAATTAAQLVEEAIGQWQVVASPFGMALTGATVVAGHTPVPTLIDGIATKVNTVDIAPPPPSVITALRTMFQATVTEGTATALSGLPGAGGKTGTAQFGDGTHAHGWFVGFDKDLAFSVLVVGGETSKPAVGAAKLFLEKALPYTR